MSEKYKVRNPDGIYFITITVIKWVDVFTRNIYKDLLIESLKYCQKEKGLILYAWCIMTNHIHLIAGSSDNHDLEKIIRDFKKFTSVHIVKAIQANYKESRKEWMLNIFRSAGSLSKKHQKFQFWRNSYHPIELVTNYMMEQKLDYLHNNPVKAGIVFSPEQYQYSSAIDYYSSLKGPIPIEFVK